MNRIFSLIVISLLVLSARLSAQDWILQNPEGLETFAVIEDIVTDTAPDVVFHLTLRHRF